MPEKIDEGFQGPPQTCGLVWSSGRVVWTRRGERRVTTAQATPEFEEAWNAACVELDEVGFSWYHSESVNFWERRDLDRVHLAAVIDSLPARVVEAKDEADRRAREAQERAERDAALRRQRAQAYIDKAREIAQESLHVRRWAWAKNSLIDEAQALIDNPELNSAGADRLIELARQAYKNVQRGEARIAVGHEPEMARASDPEIVAAARAAVIDITTFDQDWAALRNDVGWSRATTVDGHILAGLEMWTQEQASHALKLLRVHRKQVAPHLQAALFPTAQLSISRAA